MESWKNIGGGLVGIPCICELLFITFDVRCTVLSS